MIWKNDLDVTADAYKWELTLVCSLCAVASWISSLSSCIWWQMNSSSLETGWIQGVNGQNHGSGFCPLSKKHVSSFQDRCILIWKCSKSNGLSSNGWFRLRTGPGFGKTSTRRPVFFIGMIAKIGFFIPKKHIDCLQNLFMWWIAPFSWHPLIKIIISRVQKQCHFRFFFSFDTFTVKIILTSRSPWTNGAMLSCFPTSLWHAQSSKLIQ